ncbi:hypothetical protein BKA70DRAFT_1572964 [Coprinopsis sp. MPI-PUGE-AT-0042]|nr:hypothetical protein BKA70DRAFT_1572964 [Coprinopsis sp. MPI-PUGE-AT-0042]
MATNHFVPALTPLQQPVAAQALPPPSLISRRWKTRTRRGVRPVLCDGTVGAGSGHLLHVSDLDDGTARSSLVQHYRRHHHDHVVQRAAILSTLDGVLNLGDFHVIAPDTPRTGDWMDRVLPGRSRVSSSSVAFQKSTRLPPPATNAAKLILSHFTKPSLCQPRPGECEISRDGGSLLVKQLASELISTTFKLLKSIDEAPAHTLTSLDVKPSIFPPGNKATRITASGYAPILSSLKSCDLDAHIHEQVLHSIGLDSVFETAQPMLRWKTAGTIKRKCIARRPLQLGVPWKSTPLGGDARGRSSHIRRSTQTR